MPKVKFLRCRDAGMLGPFCDYIIEGENDEEVLRETRVHAATHHEREITDEELQGLKKKIKEKE